MKVVQKHTNPNRKAQAMLNIRLTSTTTPVKAEVTTTPDVPTEELGTCTDCKSELSTLTGSNGEIRAVFCEYCEFGC
jgi:hypothetical protein